MNRVLPSSISIEISSPWTNHENRMLWAKLKHPHILSENQDNPGRPLGT